VGSVYYLDSNIIIALVELPDDLEAGQRTFLEAMERGTALAVTSELTLAECLVGSYATNNRQAATAFLALFEDGDAPIVAPVSRDILVRAAQLRAETRMLLADSVHVATAELTGCTVVVSQDKRMRVPDGMRLARWTGFRVED